MTDIKAGDYVEITADRERDIIGERGTIVRVDSNDDDLPYRVELPERGYAVWVRAVRKVDIPSPTSREGAVTRAKELLAGTDFNGADVIRLAEFLAAGKD